MDIETLIFEHHQRALKARRIDELINTPRFRRKWEDLTEEEREKVAERIKDLDPSGISSAFNDSLELGEKSIRQLRIYAAQLGVKNYTRMNKAVLLSGIRQYEKMREDRKNSRTGS